MATVPKSLVDAEPIIRAIAQEFAKQYNARNLDKLGDLFTDDGRMQSPFHPPAEGAKALRKHFEQAFKEYDPRSLTVETTHVEVSGDMAFSVGTFEMSLRIPSGRRLADRGKWLVALRRVGVGWRIVAHCFNTDLPITSFNA